jgi:hypothetical protein
VEELPLPYWQRRSCDVAKTPYLLFFFSFFAAFFSFMVFSGFFFSLFFESIPLAMASSHALVDQMRRADSGEESSAPQMLFSAECDACIVLATDLVAAQSDGVPQRSTCGARPDSDRSLAMRLFASPHAVGQSPPYDDFQA